MAHSPGSDFQITFRFRHAVNKFFAFYETPNFIIMFTEEALALYPR